MLFNNQYILFLAFFIVCYQPICGQKLTTGISSGVVISSIDDNDQLIGEKSNGTGLAIAGNFTVHLSEKFSLRTELGYERKGNTRTIESYYGQETPVARTVTSSLIDYLSMPLLAQLSFGKKAKIMVSAGPSISYMLKYTKKDTYGVTYETTETFNHTYAYKRLDFSMTGGLGFLLPVNQHWALTGDARYFRGFVSLPESSSRSEQKNFGVVFRVGLQYVLKSDKAF